MYEAAGPRWHKRDRRKGRIPSRLRNMDTESAWFKSGYRGWVQGYRLLLQGLVFPESVPLFAAWRRNSEGEATVTAQAPAGACRDLAAKVGGIGRYGRILFRRVGDEAAFSAGLSDAEFGSV
jgi:hypothetical protein